jgi:hypothetical protein
VQPALTHCDIGAALTWLEEAFGFEGQVLDEAGAIVRFRGGITLVTCGQPGCLLADLGRLPIPCSTVAPRSVRPPGSLARVRGLLRARAFEAGRR